MHTNEQFIKALNRKKEEAFQMLFKDYYASLVMYAMHYVRQEVAEDIVQDVITELYSRRLLFDTPVALKSFLFLSVKNKALKIVSYLSQVKRWTYNNTSNFYSLRQKKN